jgi:hypothetical protein
MPDVGFLMSDLFPGRIYCSNTFCCAFVRFNQFKWYCIFRNCLIAGILACSLVKSVM